MADQVLHQCQGHTHIQILFQDECFEVFCSQPWSLLMPPVFWQFFVGLFATAHTPQGHFLVLVYQRRTAGSWKHTHRWKWRLCHGSVSPFKVLKRKKAEQKQSVCVCEIQIQTFRQSQLSAAPSVKTTHGHTKTSTAICIPPGDLSEKHLF